MSSLKGLVIRNSQPLMELSHLLMMGPTVVVSSAQPSNLNAHTTSTNVGFATTDATKVIDPIPPSDDATPTAGKLPYDEAVIDTPATDVIATLAQNKCSTTV